MLHTSEKTKGKTKLSQVFCLVNNHIFKKDYLKKLNHKKLTVCFAEDM